jgi:hypothetical protein
MNRRFEAVRTIATVVVAQAREVIDFPARGERFLHAAALVITGGIAEMVLVWLDGGLEITRDELVELCVELMLMTGDNAPEITTRLATRPQRASPRAVES